MNCLKELKPHAWKISTIVLLTIVIVMIFSLIMMSRYYSSHPVGIKIVNTYPIKVQGKNEGQIQELIMETK